MYICLFLLPDVAYETRHQFLWVPSVFLANDSVSGGNTLTCTTMLKSCIFVQPGASMFIDAALLPVKILFCGITLRVCKFKLLLSYSANQACLLLVLSLLPEALQL